MMYLIYLQSNGNNINAGSSYNTYDRSNFPELEEIKGGLSLVLYYVVNVVRKLHAGLAYVYILPFGLV